ncbi:MAG: DUF5789 family protein [Halarchaeum sp.]
MTLARIPDLLERPTYPVSTETLRERYGDARIDHPNGEERLGDVLARTGVDEFADADEATTAVYAALGRAAVGRVGYSDRDPAPADVGTRDPVSF